MRWFLCPRAEAGGLVDAVDDGEGTLAFLSVHSEGTAVGDRGVEILNDDGVTVAPVGFVVGFGGGVRDALLCLAGGADNELIIRGDEQRLFALDLKFNGGVILQALEAKKRAVAPPSKRR